MSDFRLSAAAAQPSIRVLDAVKQKDGYAYPPAFGSPGLLRPTDARSRHTFDTVWLALRHYHEEPHCSTLRQFEDHRLAHNFLVTGRHYCLAYSEIATCPVMGTTPNHKPLYMFAVNFGAIPFSERELDDGYIINPDNFNTDRLALLHKHLDWLYSIRLWSFHPADRTDIDTAIVHLLRQQAQIIIKEGIAA